MAQHHLLLIKILTGAHPSSYLIVHTGAVLHLSLPASMQATFPIEILSRIIHMFVENRNPQSSSLEPLSLSSSAVCEILRGIQFRMATISSYMDIKAYKEMAKEASNLFRY